MTSPGHDVTVSAQLLADAQLDADLRATLQGRPDLFNALVASQANATLRGAISVLTGSVAHGTNGGDPAGPGPSEGHDLDTDAIGAATVAADMHDGQNGQPEGNGGQPGVEAPARLLAMQQQQQQPVMQPAVVQRQPVVDGPSAPQHEAREQPTARELRAHHGALVQELHTFAGDARDLVGRMQDIEQILRESPEVRRGAPVCGDNAVPADVRVQSGAMPAGAGVMSGRNIKVSMPPIDKWQVTDMRTRDAELFWRDVLQFSWAAGLYNTEGAVSAHLADALRQPFHKFLASERAALGTTDLPDAVIKRAFYYVAGVDLRMPLLEAQERMSKGLDKQQQGEDVMAYILRFRHLHSLVGTTIDEPLQCIHFVDGLLPDMHKLCATDPMTGQKWRQLEPLLKYAQGKGADMSSPVQGRVAAMRGRDKGKGGRANFRGRMRGRGRMQNKALTAGLNHGQGGSFSGGRGGGRGSGGGRSYGHGGHTGGRGGRGGRGNGGGRGTGTMDNVQCFQCQGWGHYADDCPSGRKRGRMGDA